MVTTVGIIRIRLNPDLHPCFSVYTLPQQILSISLDLLSSHGTARDDAIVLILWNLPCPRLRRGGINLYVLYCCLKYLTYCSFGGYIPQSPYGDTLEFFSKEGLDRKDTSNNKTRPFLNLKRTKYWSRNGIGTAQCESAKQWPLNVSWASS